MRQGLVGVGAREPASSVRSQTAARGRRRPARSLEGACGARARHQRWRSTRRLAVDSNPGTAAVPASTGAATVRTSRGSQALRASTRSTPQERPSLLRLDTSWTAGARLFGSRFGTMTRRVSTRSWRVGTPQGCVGMRVCRDGDRACRRTVSMPTQSRAVPARHRVGTRCEACRHTTGVSARPRPVSARRCVGIVNQRVGAP